MVSLLKFAVSTLHVWEKGGSCAFPSAPHEVFSLGTFSLGHDRYCFALADVVLDLPHGTSFRHNVWPLTVMLEMIACAVVLGYLWSAFLGDKAYHFELHSPSCIARAMSDLKRGGESLQVVRFRGGDRDVVNRALQVFQTIGSLPFLWKFAADNYQQIPIPALTAMLRGLGQKQVVIKPSKNPSSEKEASNPCTPISTKKLELQQGEEPVGSPSQLSDLCAQLKGRAIKPSKQPNPSTDKGTNQSTPMSIRKLESLELQVQELVGSPSELMDLCAQLKGSGCSSLRHVKIYFWRHTERDQTIRNEATLLSLLGALKHHPTLQELEIKAPIGLLPTQSNPEVSIDTKPPQQPTTPIMEALLAVVQTCSSLIRLRLNLWSRRRTRGDEEAGDEDMWYIGPLAEVLSQPSFYTRSNLESLELLFCSQPTQGTTFTQGLAALENIVRCNYNLTHLFVGPSHDDEEYGDAYDYDNMLYHRDMHLKYSPTEVACLNSTRLHVTLNRLGRKRLVTSPQTTRKDWARAILRDKDNISLTYCWISMHPAVLNDACHEYELDAVFSAQAEADACFGWHDLSPKH